MAKQNIVVVGASAGGITALISFIRSLPEDFGGSVFIVLHIPAHAQSMLPQILARETRLRVAEARDGETIVGGKIYVAASDHHLLIEDNKVLVKRGPKENRFRPSIDALFRSAAYSFGPRVTGIVLSGMLNDGTSGLWTVRRLGGTTIIQEPEEAEYPQMPQNVLEYVEVDHVLSASAIGPMLNQISKVKTAKKPKLPSKDLQLLKTEIVIARQDGAFQMGIMEMGELTPFTCPECHGTLVRLAEGNIIRFRCHTGHAFTASSLLAEATQSVEDLLWQGMRGMEEVAMLLTTLQVHFTEMGDREAAALFETKALEASSRARVIHNSVSRQEQYSEDIRYEKEGQRKSRPVKTKGSSA